MVDYNKLMKLTIKRFDKTLPLPHYEEKGAACFDFTIRSEVTFKPMEIKLVPLNVAIKVPDGYALLVFARSSTPLRKGLIVPHGAGIVDPFYCGDNDEILIELMNKTETDVTVKRGEFLAQGMVIKVEEIDWQETETMGSVGKNGYQLLEKDEREK